MVSVFASVNHSLHHKVQTSLLAPADPGGPRKRAIKRLWWWVVKGIFVSFFRHKISEAGFVKIKEYIRKKKKQST